MGDLVVALAFFDGFVGQLFEYWPFTLTIAITVGYVVIAFGYDVVFGRQRKGPPGAQPRVEIAVDPTLKARNRYRTGLYLLRLAVSVAVVMAVAIAYVGHNPLSIGSQYGLSQETNAAVAMGTNVGLVAAVVAVLAAIWVRAVPLMLIGLVDLSLIIIPFAPPLLSGQWSALGLTAFLMAIPLILAATGTGIVLSNYSTAYPPRAVADEAQPVSAR